MKARYPSAIKSVQLATFAVTFGATGQASQNATITAVDPAKSIVELIAGPSCRYYSGSDQWGGWLGAALADSTTLTCYRNITSFAGTSQTVHLTFQVTEYYEKPKSLQVVAGNGSASQTIAAVDTGRARLVSAFLFTNMAQEIYVSSLASTAVTWSRALDSYAAKYQVVEQ